MSGCLAGESSEAAAALPPGAGANWLDVWQAPHLWSDGTGGLRGRPGSDACDGEAEPEQDGQPDPAWPEIALPVVVAPQVALKPLDVPSPADPPQTAEGLAPEVAPPATESSGSPVQLDVPGGDRPGHFLALPEAAPDLAALHGGLSQQPDPAEVRSDAAGPARIHSLAGGVEPVEVHGGTAGEFSRAVSGRRPPEPAGAAAHTVAELMLKPRPTQPAGATAGGSEAPGWTGAKRGAAEEKGLAVMRAAASPEVGGINTQAARDSVVAPDGGGTTAAALGAPGQDLQAAPVAGRSGGAAATVSPMASGRSAGDDEPRPVKSSAGGPPEDSPGNDGHGDAGIGKRFPRPGALEDSPGNDGHGDAALEQWPQPGLPPAAPADRFSGPEAAVSRGPESGQKGEGTARASQARPPEEAPAEAGRLSGRLDLQVEGRQGERVRIRLWDALGGIRMRMTSNQARVAEALRADWTRLEQALHQAGWRMESPPVPVPRTVDGYTAWAGRTPSAEDTALAARPDSARPLEFSGGGRPADGNSPERRQPQEEMREEWLDLSALRRLGAGRS